MAVFFRCCDSACHRTDRCAGQQRGTEDCRRTYADGAAGQGARSWVVATAAQTEEDNSGGSEFRFHVNFPFSRLTAISSRGDVTARRT